jgi:conjugal transfer ATP-binding protein TraC
MSDNPALVKAARKLAFNIREFTSHGFHGKFFTGPSTFDIHRDAFVVLELENLKIQPDLYRVVTCWCSMPSPRISISPTGPVPADHL